MTLTLGKMLSFLVPAIVWPSVMGLLYLSQVLLNLSFRTKPCLKETRSAFKEGTWESEPSKAWNGQVCGSGCPTGGWPHLVL